MYLLTNPPDPTQNLPSSRAAAYLRYVSYDTNETTLRRTRDEARIHQVIQDDGRELVALYQDLGISGWSRKNRPGLTEMLAAAQAGAFTILYLTNWDRLSRNRESLLALLQELKQAGVSHVRCLDTFPKEILLLPPSLETLQSAHS